MWKRARRVRGLVLGLAGVLIVVAQGCSDGEPPRPSEPPSPTARVTSTAGPAALARALELGSADGGLGTFLRSSERGLERSGAFLTSPGWRSTARGAVAARIGATADAPFHVGLGPNDQNAIQLVRDGARRVEVELHDGRALFVDAYPSTDLVAVATEERYEELLVLRDPQAPHSFSWTFALSAALPDVTTEIGGSVAFLDIDGAPAIRVPRPFAIDAHGVRRDADLTLEGSKLVIDLDTSNLTFPVLLDPAFDRGVWNLVFNSGPPAGPSSRFGHAMAFHPTADAVILFGGFQTEGGSTTVADTWRWNGTNWLQLFANGPPAKRRWHTLTFDASQNQIVMFGGYDGVVLSDTWVFNGSTWTQKFPAGNPGGRWAHATAYVPGTGVLLFGGHNNVNALNDLWVWNGAGAGSWTQLCTANPCNASKPTPRRWHSMAFDQLGNHTVVFGGFDTAYFGDTVAYNASTNLWTTLSTTGPAAREGAAMAFDTTRRKLVLHGGAVSGGGYVNDTWEWNGSAWVQPSILNAPNPSRRQSAMAFDPTRDRMVLFSGDGNTVTEPHDTHTYYMRGNTCSPNGPSNACNTGWCTDGVCCEVQSCGTCQRCDDGTANGSGTCTTVMNAEDPNSCSGANACDAAGVCKKKNGQTCVAGSECLSGNCIDGYCCVDTCTTPCRSCANVSGTCTTVVSSVDDNFCNGVNTCDASGVCKKKTGQTCAGPNECASGFCADGTCCQNACTTPCRSCANAAGTCTNVVASQDDNNCNGTSSCDAAGVCKKENGQVCTVGGECLSGNCIDNTCCADTCTTPCRSCANASGTCTTVISNTDDNNCNGTSSCDGAGVCKKENGQACGAAAECLSGNCVDGTCCADGCTTPCRSCANAAGTCTTLVTSGDDNTCSGNNTCDASGACKLDLGQACTGATQCASGFCVDGTCCANACTTPCRSCANAAGSCTTLVTNQTDDNCSTPNSCDGTATCKKAAGQSCTTATECASGICKDGTCCTSACTGSCQSCANPSGTCNPVSSGDDADTCTGANTCVSGACKKKNGQSCAAALDCASGNCKDNTCCSSACTGACQSCANATGACTSVTNAEDADTCTGNNVCDGAGACKKKNGQSCAAQSECASAICKDNTCCSTGCTGTCQSCANSTGSCQTVTGASDPDTCAAPNACDVAGQCKLLNGQACSSGAECVSGFCVDGFCCDTTCAGGCDACSAALGATQDGKCTIQPAGALGSGCNGFLCSGSSASCPTSCIVSTQCAPGYYCDGTACVLKKALGDSCSGAGECTSNFCADGVCCNTACSGKCMACAAANKQSGIDSGTCDAAKQGTNPGNQCVLSSDPCGEQASCSGTPGACSMAPFGKSCGPTTCAGGAVSGKICDGTGTCIDQTNAQCTPYVCQNGACTSPCGVDTDCVSTHYCANGTCVAKSQNGLGCSASNQCESGFCVDSVCCDAPCNGQCEACDATGSVGQCTTITGAPHGNKPACAGSGVCQGTCDGTDPTACTFAGNATECAAAGCTGDVSQPAGTCDGTGSCSVPATQNCVPYACDAAAGTCKTSCASDADCGQGAKCDTASGKCAVTSATCKDEHTVLLPNGQEQSCEPYKCVGGACQQQCTSDTDCASGFECNAPSCVPVQDSGTSGAGGGGGIAGSTDGGAGAAGSGGASSGGDDGGCGCRVAGTRDARHGEAGFGLILLLLALRRRRGVDATRRAA